MLLVDRGDPGGLGKCDLATVRLQIAQNELEQRGFSDPVAAHESNLRTGRQRDRGFVKEPAAPSVEDEIIDLKHLDLAER